MNRHVVPVLAVPIVQPFWYLGTPYSKHPDGIDAAYDQATTLVMRLADRGVAAYSPIAHTHRASRYEHVEPGDSTFFINRHLDIIQRAHGLLVGMLDGWNDSKGLAEEISMFGECRKPILYVVL